MTRADLHLRTETFSTIEQNEKKTSELKASFRKAHNPKVVGSNPAAATKKSCNLNGFRTFLVKAPDYNVNMRRICRSIKGDELLFKIIESIMV